MSLIGAKQALAWGKGSLQGMRYSRLKTDLFSREREGLREIGKNMTVGAGTKPDRDGSKPDWETEQNRILAIGWRNWLVLMDL